MKQVVELDNGTKVEITEEGIVITSTSGNRLCVDSYGNVIPEKKVTSEKPDWLKYFFLMGKEEREAVRQWLAQVTLIPRRQEFFVEIVKKALNFIDYDYRIATIEPSMDESGMLFYKKGEKVARGIVLGDWEKKGKEFVPEWGSDLANLYELFLWYAYRIAKNLWSIEYVCEDSSSAGNYRNSPTASHDFEVSGEQKVGGFFDGVGNTYRIVTHKEKCAICGGLYRSNGGDEPVASMCYACNLCAPYDYGTGVLVLRRSIYH